MSLSSSAVPVRSLADPLDEIAATRLADLLPAHVAQQRWFRAKTRTIDRVEIADILSLPNVSAHVLILLLHYADGETDQYILPLSVEPVNRAERTAVVARLQTDSEQAVLFNSLEDPAFRSALLNAIACENTITGRSGSLAAQKTSAFSERCGSPALSALESFVSRAEQSNTSIIYKDHYILKLFRKLESGVNPDLEVGAFLTAHKFPNTPAVLGSIVYRPSTPEDESAVAILQQFVPNQGDAWKYTLDELAGFFDKALAAGHAPPHRTSEHPLDLLTEPIPPEMRAFIGSYLESAALLGKRTAEMHVALASDASTPDFAPEPFTAADSAQLYRDLTGQADVAFGLLRGKLAAFSGPVAEQARHLLSHEHQVSAHFAALERRSVDAVRIRCHGDYHLGQVLRTADDFMIIDFEGEPARPLSERRAKMLVLRDVAGMVRSFQYAAYAALFGQVPDIAADPATRDAVENWGAAWNAYVSTTYLRAYFETAGNPAFLPDSWVERRLLLDAFLLHKALYELAYELNNRPDWLPIPVRGILSLVG